MSKKFKSSNGMCYHLPTVVAGISTGIITLNDLPDDVVAKVKRVEDSKPVGRVLSGYVMRETKDAVCFMVASYSKLHGGLWFPRSHIIAMCETSIRVTDWIYKQKGGE